MTHAGTGFGGLRRAPLWVLGSTGSQVARLRLCQVMAHIGTVAQHSVATDADRRMVVRPWWEHYETGVVHRQQLPTLVSLRSPTPPKLLPEWEGCACH